MLVRGFVTVACWYVWQWLAGFALFVGCFALVWIGLGWLIACLRVDLCLFCSGGLTIIALFGWYWLAVDDFGWFV